MKRALCIMLALITLASTIGFSNKAEATSENSNLTVKTISGGDSTKITLKGTDGKTKTILIDVGYGENTDKLVGTGKNINIDYLILTHNHIDHIDRLQNLANDASNGKRKITVTYMYINATKFKKSKLENGEEYNPADVYEAFLSNKNITVKYIFLMVPNGQDSSAYDDTVKAQIEAMLAKGGKSTTVKFKNSTLHPTEGDYTINILPPIYDFNEKADGGDYEYIDVNNSSLTVVLRKETGKKTKYVFAGDLQGTAYKAIMACNTTKHGKTYSFTYDEQTGTKGTQKVTISISSDYYRLFGKSSEVTTPSCNTYKTYTYDEVYYKVSHHGKRDKNNFKASAEPNKYPLFSAELQLLNHMHPDYIIGTAWKNNAEGKNLKANYEVIINALNWKDSKGRSVKPSLLSTFN